MVSSLHLATYSGCGNTFLIHEKPSFVPCNADGVVCLVPSDKADFGMRIFNRDGSEAKMCGNGLRCLVAYLKDTGRIEASCTVESQSGIHTCFIDDEITVSHPMPRLLGVKIVEGYEWHWIDAGVPHAVTYVDAFPENYLEIAQRVRQSTLFSPSGVNVNFAILDEFHSATMRTYERGVEGETKACGTGAIALAFASGAREIRFAASGYCVSIREQDGQLWLTGEAGRV